VISDLRYGFCINSNPYEDLATSFTSALSVTKRFIDERHLERRIRKMKKIYKARRDYVKKCLTEQFGDTVKIFGDSTGLHLVAEFQNIVFLIK